MNVWLLDYETFVKVNGIKEITNPVMFDKGHIPTEDGLFSTEIFGVSMNERKGSWGYIDLGVKFIAPKVYISLKRLNRNFESIVYSTKKFSIKNGILVEDSENGGTGIKWLYDNWEKIKFQKNDSSSRNERVDLLTKNKKDIIFTSKEIVIPAFFRDVNLQSGSGNIKASAINDLYAKIIRNVNMIKESNNMDFIISSLTGKTQDLLVDVYNELKVKLEKKHGYIRSFLMGKSIDYASRVVITAAPFKAEVASEHEVDFYHAGIPLSHVVSEFYPFILWWVKRWFKSNVENVKGSCPILDNQGKKILVELDEPESFYNDDFIERNIDNFVENPYSRFDKIPLKIKEEDMKLHKLKGDMYMRLEGKTPSEITTMNKESIEGYDKDVSRHITWTDLLYMAAIDVTEDKHVVITRYPMLDYNGSFPSRVYVISTRETMPMMINGKIYYHYPLINPDVKKEELDSIFRDTITLNQLYLDALGGDHDGDQITAKGIFSQEANQEAEEVMVRKMNLLSITGEGNRTVGKEAAQTLYSFTRFH